MASPIYKFKGTWVSTAQYSYLDAAKYGVYTYICISNDGSLNQEPDQSPLVWVKMPVISQEDQYYLRSRTDLLQYEDARFQSLINAMTDYYPTRNDQSIWGAFLRSVAIELARIDYLYSYDIVAKNPIYLTPPDIKRIYADSLSVVNTAQQPYQFDSGDFGTPFGLWVANAGVISRSAIVDSNGNLQAATTYGTSGTTEPYWAIQIGETTTDNTVTWTNYGSAPTQLIYPVGYRDMLVDLIAAYQEGATVKSIEEVIYAYTGKKIIVEELYKQITPTSIYDQSDRNTIKVSVNVGGKDPFTDITNLNELQQITNSLYGAIDLAKPAHVGLQLTTVFGSGETVACFITPRFQTAYQLNALPLSQQAFYSLVSYIVQPSVVGWKKSNEYTLGSIIQDSNGNIQLATMTGVSSSSVPTWNTTLQGTTTDNGVVWINIGTLEITIEAYASLPTSQKAIYQGYYQDLNCVGSGIDAFLIIKTIIVEEPPFNPMLYLAPIYDKANPTTVLAAYGLHMRPILSSDAWQQLLNIPAVWNGVTTFNKGALIRGRNWATSGSFNMGVWTVGGWQLYRAKKKNSGQDPLTDMAQTYWTPLSSPSTYQAYYPMSNGQYSIGIKQWAPNTSFYVGQFMLDANGNLQIAAIISSIQSPPSLGVTSPIATIGTGYNAVQISNNLLTLFVNSTNGMGLVAGVSLVQLLRFTYATFLNGLTLPVVSFTSNSITMRFNPSLWVANRYYSSGNIIQDSNGNFQVASTSGYSSAYTPLWNTTIQGTTIDNGVTWINQGTSYNSGSQLEAYATAQIGFSQITSVPTYDGTIVWQCLGVNFYNDPNKWIQVVDTTNSPTGEVSNTDITHQMGLLAPRLDSVWEISGEDQITSLEIE